MTEITPPVETITQNPAATPLANELLTNFVKRTLRRIIYGSAAIIVVVVFLDLVVLGLYGLEVMDETMNAEGNFALPIVTGAIGIGVAYAWFHEKHPGVHLFRD